MRTKAIIFFVISCLGIIGLREMFAPAAEGAVGHVKDAKGESE